MYNFGGIVMKKHWKLRFTLSLLVPLGFNLFYSLPTHASETNIQTNVKVDAQSSKTITSTEINQLL